MNMCVLYPHHQICLNLLNLFKSGSDSYSLRRFSVFELVELGRDHAGVLEGVLSDLLQVLPVLLQLGLLGLELPLVAAQLRLRLDPLVALGARSSAHLLPEVLGLGQLLRQVRDLPLEVERVLPGLQQLVDLVGQRPILTDVCLNEAPEVLERVLELVQTLSLLLQLLGEPLVHFSEFWQFLGLQTQILVLRA